MTQLEDRTPHTDIQNDHPLIAALPVSLKPYAQLARLDRPIGIWLLGLPAFWGLFMGGITMDQWYLVLYFALGTILMRGAGCTINDLLDHKIDQKVERTALRPLPSGAISRKAAKLFLTMQLLAASLLLIQLPDMTIFLGFFSLLLIGAYPLMKRITYWPQLFLGVTFNWGFLMGICATGADLSIPALLIYVGAIFWTLGYDTIYAHQDKKDDALLGMKSTALLFKEKSKDAVSIIYGLSLILIGLGLFLNHFSLLWSFLFLITAGAHFFWQILTWHMDDPASSLRVFKSNRDLGILILLIFIGENLFYA